MTSAKPLETANHGPGVGKLKIEDSSYKCLANLFSAIRYHWYLVYATSEQERNFVHLGEDQKIQWTRLEHSYNENNGHYGSSNTHQLWAVNYKFLAKLLTDNRIQLNSKSFHTICAELDVKLFAATEYHHLTNG